MTYTNGLITTTVTIICLLIQSKKKSLQQAFFQKFLGSKYIGQKIRHKINKFHTYLFIRVLNNLVV